MRQEVRITGIGGQGAITVGHVLGRAAALHDGREVVVTEGYSPYITGGWSRADVVISDEPIDFPLVTRPDALVAMYQEGLELNAKTVKPTGVILVERRFVKASDPETNTKLLSIPAADEADRLGRKVLMNVVLLGSLVAVTSVVSRDALEKAVTERFPKAAEMNMKALEAGFRLAQEQSALEVAGTV